MVTPGTTSSKELLPGYGFIWQLSLPIIFAAVSETVVEVSDTIFLARYGTAELASLGLAASVLGVALFLCLGIVEGMQITMARRMGELRLFAVGEVFDQGLYLLAVSSFMAVAAVLVAPSCIGAYLVSPEVRSGIGSYLHIGAYGIIFQSFNLACSVFFVAVSRTRVLIGATVVLAVTNILLDYTLIFGNWGLPELGIAGAAAASLCAEICASAYFWVHIQRYGYIAKFRLLHFGRIQFGLCRQLLRLSWPVSLEVLVEMGKWFVFFLIAERLGEFTLGMITIGYSCYLVLLIPVDSFAESACSIGSNLIGRGQAKEMRSFLRRMIHLGYATIAPLLLATLIWPEAIMMFFSDDPSMVQEAGACLPIITIAMLLAVPAEMLFAVLEGTGDTIAMLIIQIFVAVLALGVAVVVGLYLNVPPRYLWSAEICGWLVCLILTGVWLRCGKWQRLQV